METAGMPSTPLGSAFGCELMLRQLVEQNLSLFMYDNARFYAERLYYENKSNENLHMLAQVYFRMGKTKQAYLILQGGQSLNHNKYLLAQCCLSLSKLEEAERVLLSNVENSNINSNKLRAVCSTVPGGPPGVYLLGLICKRGHRREAAIKYFRMSLEMDSTLWCSITELSSMGESIDSQKLFSIDINDACSYLKEVESSRIVHMTQQPMKSSTFHPNMGYGPLGGENGTDGGEEASHTRTVLDLQHRREAESSTGLVAESPTVSLSLGLSSSSMQVPFATPGSMPMSHYLSSLRNNNTSLQSGQSQLSGPGYVDGTFMLPANMSHSHYSACSTNQSNNNNTGNSYAGQPQAGPLFEMDTPVTPISLHHHRSGARDSLESAPYTGDSTTPYSHSQGAMNTPAQSNYNRYGMGNMTGISSIGGSVGPGSTAVKKGGHTGPVSHGGRFGRSGSNVPTDALQGSLESGHSRGAVGYNHGGGKTEVARRVSFGPDVHKTPPPPPQGRDPRTDSRDSNDDENDGNNNNHDTGSNEYMNSNDSTGSNDSAGNVSSTESISNVNTYPHKSQKVNGHDINTSTDTSANNDKNTSAISANTYLANITNTSSGGGYGTVDGGGAAHNSDLSSLDASRYLSSLLTLMLYTQELLSEYRCRECISFLHKLPKHQFSSAWVQHTLGTAYYEINEYRPALLALKEMLRLEPFRLDGIEILSTVLWHLKKEKDLSALAQQVVEIDKLSPQVWCVVGNCFSLQREPESAIKFFQRSLQIDPLFTYAYTLSGHESVNNEDLEKAVNYFRQAILCDERHYSAWYGLGAIYYRQERFELAEYHFRKALSINGASSVLSCYLGMVLYAQDNESKNDEAFNILSKACRANPKNPQLRFQRAHAFLAHDDLGAALEELEIVRDLAPREPSIYILLGQVLQKLGNHTDALYNFNMALDLDPKEAAALKSAIDQIPDPDASALLE